MEPNKTGEYASQEDADFAYTVTQKEEPLQELTSRFLEAFVSGGGIVDVCGCGRMHVFTCNNEDHFSKGELEGYEASAKLEPNRYLFHDYSSSSAGEVNGKRFVMDCDCLERRFGPAARNIWRYRHVLIEFIRNENKSREDKVNQTKEGLASLPAELPNYEQT